MWTTPLSVTGLEPASQYISTGYVPEAYGYLVPCQTWEQDEDGVWVMTGNEPGDPVAVYEAASQAGVECTQAAVDALFDVADVTVQDPFVAMGRLGLQLVQESSP